MKKSFRPWLALVLNILFLPMGYYYLKSNLRFWIFTFFFIWGMIAFNFLLFFLPQKLIVVICVFMIAFMILLYIVWDTWKISKNPNPSNIKFYYRPRAYAFVPIFIILLWTAQNILDQNNKPFVDMHRIGSSAMQPTIDVGDLILVKTFFSENEIQRGDIVTFTHPEYPELKGKKLIKRIIGIPGDKITISSHKISINNLTIKYIPLNSTEIEQFIPELDFKKTEKDMVNIYFWEVISDSSGDKTINKHIVAIYDNLIHINTFADREIMIPEGKYFVMGDNRPRSDDSRRYGPILIENIIGKYSFTYFSVDLKTRECNIQYNICPLPDIFDYIKAPVRWSRTDVKMP